MVSDERQQALIKQIADTFDVPYEIIRDLQQIRDAEVVPLDVLMLIDNRWQKIGTTDAKTVADISPVETDTEEII